MWSSFWGQLYSANHLILTVTDQGITTTYQWDNSGRLITTTVDSQMTRLYQYNQRGLLITATVDSLVTTFLYDGQGRRRQMSVAGETTTYVLDYLRNNQVLYEEGGAFANTKHYLYGLECIAELVDDGEPESEWRFYHRDGRDFVRQTTNTQATITLAWTYSPEGMVLIGERGPVTHLDCGEGAVYDWSTGLIFKNGRYFDPGKALWITVSGAVVYSGRLSRRYKRKRSKQSRLLRLFVITLMLLMLALTGCDNPGPIDETPTPTPCAPELATPVPPLETPLYLPIDIVLFYDWRPIPVPPSSDKIFYEYDDYYPVRDIQIANDIFMQANIIIQQQNTTQIDAPLTEEVLSIGYSGQPTGRTVYDFDVVDERTRLMSTSNNGNVITAYYVPVIQYGNNQTAGGVAHIPPETIIEHYPSNMAPALASSLEESSFAVSAHETYAITSERTFAHELGHVLGLGHMNNDPNNLMYPTTSTKGTELDSNQVRILRRNVWRYLTH